MYTRIRRGIKSGAYNYCEFIADYNSDIANLPTTSSSGTTEANTYEPCCAGSKVYIIGTRKSYMLSNGDVWELFVDYTTQGGGGGTTFDVTDDGEGNVSII